MILYLQKLTDTAIVPTKESTHAACYDVYADLKERTITSYSSVNNKKTTMNFPGDEPIFNLYPGERAAIPTGWKMTTEANRKIVLAPRSGNSFKQGVTTANALAQIDRDYRNEVFVLLTNNSKTIIKIKHGERIAQLAIEKVIPVEIIVVEALPEIDSNRIGGLGSTGK